MALENPGDETWRPTASMDVLRLRARMLSEIRRFFAEREVLEVETPLLASAGASDVHIASLKTCIRPGHGEPSRRVFLQPSPEFAMKRLLAAGSGPIFQIAKAFRDAESGPCHNPEFTLLEWYRPGFDHHALMDEVDELLDTLVGPAESRRISYRAAFREHAGIDPVDTPLAEIRSLGERFGLSREADAELDRDDYLDFFLSERVQPALTGRTYIYDFPPTQASLARVRPGDLPTAERFELFLDRLEVANGYHELTESNEQRERFARDRRARKRRGFSDIPIDEYLLAALTHGLPACSGVAMGLDRLVMSAVGAKSLQQVLAFPIDRA